MSFRRPRFLAPKTEQGKERLWRSAVAMLFMIGTLVPSSVLQAQSAPVTFVKNIVFILLGYLLELIINWMGNFVLLLVTVLIDVAQFNTFVNASAVQMGWPLVRDVTNMFFIVILLVTAFATIVRWQKWDYKKILPKLLLMAVLVNFSKTLIGLLIDFSQVVMLTFVNGFQAAAGGNFVEAFKLTEILKFAQNREALDLDSSNPQNTMLVELILSGILGVIFLMWTIILLLIMVIYLFFRIVGLWVALIMSPLAFFAIALRETSIGNKLGAVGEEFWGKLGAMLTGGPIMAFFIWLTLATVQGDGFGTFLKVAEGSAEEQQAVESFFRSAISNVESVSAFIVASVMLMMGVQMAISIGGQFSQQFAGAAGHLRDFGTRGTRFLAYGGALAGGAAAARGALRGGRAVARGAGRGAIRLAERPAAAAAAVGQRAALAVGAYGAAKTLGKVAAAPRKRVVRKMKAFEEATQNMSTADRMKALEGIATSRITPGGSTRKAASESLAKMQLSAGGQKVIKANALTEAKAQGFTGIDADAQASKISQQTLREAMDRRYKAAIASGDDDEIKKANEEREKFPHLLAADKQVEQIEMMMGKMTPIEMAKNIHQSAYQDASFADKIIEKTGMMKTDENGNKSFDKDNPYYKAFVESGGIRSEILKDRLGNEGSAGFYVRDKSSGKMALRSDEEIATARAQAAAEPKGLPEIRQRRTAAIAAGRDRLMRARGDGNETEIQGTQLQLMQAGANINEAYNVNANQQFVDEADRNNFATNVRAIHKEGKKNIKVYNQMDVKTMFKNKDKPNEVRQQFVKNTSMQDLREAHQVAAGSGDKASSKAVANMVKAVDMEGSRAEGVLNSFAKEQQTAGKPVDVSVMKADIMKAATQASKDSAGGQAALTAALKDTKLAGSFTMDDAQAILKREQIKLDKQLRSYSESVTSRAKDAIGGSIEKAAGAAAKGAAGAAGAVTPSGRAARRMERAGEEADRSRGQQGGGTPGGGTPAA